MTTFLDSSALVKRYAAEEDSELVLGLDDVVVASEISRVEVASALWRKHRLGELSADDADLLSRQFAVDCDDAAGFVVLTALGPAVLATAARMVARHPLRAYDAVQLASALAVSDALGECSFGCFDRALSTAASAEGLRPAW